MNSRLSTSAIKKLSMRRSQVGFSSLRWDTFNTNANDYTCTRLQPTVFVSMSTCMNIKHFYSTSTGKVSPPSTESTISTSTSVNQTAQASSDATAAGVSQSTSGFGEVPSNVEHSDTFSGMIEKMDSTLLDTLSNFAPSSYFQSLLEYMHEALGMPWWTSIALTGIALRLMFLPLSIRSLRNVQKMKNVQPELQKLLVEAKYLEKKDTDLRIILASKRNELFKREGISIWASLQTLIQVPFFAGLFFALRSMRDQLHHGGILWFTDLSQPDLGLTAILTSTLLLGHYVNTKEDWSTNYAIPEEHRKRSRVSGRIMILGVGLIASQLESAILIYWIPAALIQISASLLLSNPNFRKRCGIPDSVKWSFADLEAYDQKLADQKLMNELEQMQKERTALKEEDREARIKEIAQQLYIQFQQLSEHFPELKQKLEEYTSTGEEISTEKFQELARLVSESTHRESIQQVIQSLEEASAEEKQKKEFVESSAGDFDDLLKSFPKKDKL